MGNYFENMHLLFSSNIGHFEMSGDFLNGLNQYKIQWKVGSRKSLNQNADPKLIHSTAEGILIREVECVD